MQKEFTIKEIKKLLKIVGETEYVSKLVPAPVFIKDTETFDELKEAIKKLRKENKKLKKELVIAKIKSGIGEVCFDIANKQRDLLRKELDTPKPVAEFKCAKANKPSKDGKYVTITRYDKNISFEEAHYENNNWFISGDEVLAFTETSPEQILKALK